MKCKKVYVRNQDISRRVFELRFSRTYEYFHARFSAVSVKFPMYVRKRFNCDRKINIDLCELFTFMLFLRNQLQF